MIQNFCLAVILLSYFSNVLATPKHSKSSAADVTELDISDLLNVQVTSVSKKAKPLSDSPSAIFVISNEDIKRSGVTSIPEALRMAPGIDVARISSNKWAVTARGFNGNFANKLLVLVDGRTVYSPSFSGVFWDAQDVMMEDVDRIEVIRGPGATLWGANAVNGVINIITKRTEDTQGGLLTAGGGNLESGFGALRYGLKLGEDSHARAYVKGFQRDNFSGAPDPAQGLDASNAHDAWEKQQGGFRIDSRLTDQDDFTFQGDIYQSHVNQALLQPTLSSPRFINRVDSTAQLAGWNITSRLKHTTSLTSEYSLQFYYDHTERRENLIGQSLDTLDLDFQHNFELSSAQNVIWGLGYRSNLDNFTNSVLLQANPRSRNTQLFSAFVQDEIQLIDDKLWLTLGSKFEHNDYTGFEGQPSIKLLWAVNTQHRFWSSISRAVRTPSRAENDITLLEGIFPVQLAANVSAPVPFTLVGSRDFKAEELLAYELGYRFAIGNQLSVDLTAFYNDYKSLRTIATDFSQLPFRLPSNFTNNGTTQTYGLESATVWQMTGWWRWHANYSYLKTDINSTDNATLNPISPNHKVSLRAELTPNNKVNLDFWLRYNSSARAVQVRTLQTVPISEYVTLDARVAWKLHPAVELSVTGQNLLDNRHIEYVDESYTLPTEIVRGVYGKLAFNF
ncbi:MAG: TonB-dependent receptor [Methylococcaceae bacterium]|jgi:iron complex outermembrane receptor protein